MRTSPSCRHVFAVALLFAGAAPVSARDAVFAAQRIDEGETIARERLRLAPARSPAESTFVRRGRVAGRVALRQIAEGEEVRRDAVGDVPSRQFRIDAATPVRVVFERFEGAVLPGQRQRTHHCAFDTATLPAAGAAWLRAQLRRSELLFAPASAFALIEGGAVDYRVRIAVGATTKTVSWSNTGAPAGVWPLVRRLEACETER